MGLLSFLLKKKYPSKKEFPVLCFNLIHSLEPIRRNWIEGCKKILGEQTSKSVNEVVVDDDPIDTLSKAFQCLICLRSIAEKSYIHPSELKVFSDLLYAEVFDHALFPCLERVRIYEKYENPSQRNHQVSEDMVRCLRRTHAEKKEILLIKPTVDIFALLTQMTAAEIFADYKTVKQKELALAELIKKQDSKGAINYFENSKSEF